MQPFGLYPANSLFVEGYLTTKGDPVEETYAMIRDAGFEIEGNDAYQDLQKQSAAEGESQFRIPDGSDQLLKPEIAQA
jgi:biotin synthase-like enzyme